MPEGGVHSVFFLPMSFQLVDSTVPLDSCIQGQVPLVSYMQASITQKVWLIDRPRTLSGAQHAGHNAMYS